MKNIKSFLVGGAVRDTLMGLEPKDKDYVVVGSNASELLSLGFEQVGMGFPVFLHPHTFEEYALARREKKVGAGYTGFEFETGLDVTLAEDLSRRDLTINSMALDDNGCIVDPFGGQRDLKNKVLRHTSDAFSEDPLRIVRLARFFARYEDFTIADETMKLCTDMVDRGALDELPDERFWKEIEKAFVDGSTVKFWELLFEIGALQQVNFFKRLFGTDWSCGKFTRVVRTAISFSTMNVFSKKLTPCMFAAAVAPDDVENLFNSVDASRVFEGLKRVRSMKPSAEDLHDLISSVRGYSYENQTLEQLSRVIRILSDANMNFAIDWKQLMNAAIVGRHVCAQEFIDAGYKGADIGKMMSQSRIEKIKEVVDLLIK